MRSTRTGGDNSLPHQNDRLCAVQAAGLRTAAALITSVRRREIVVGVGARHGVTRGLRARSAGTPRAICAPDAATAPALREGDPSTDRPHRHSHRLLPPPPPPPPPPPHT